MTVTGDGKNSSIPDPASSFSNSLIGNGDIVVSLMTMSGTINSSDSPHISGSVNIFAASGRSVVNGQISGIQFGKSEISRGTTDSVDLIVIAAR